MFGTRFFDVTEFGRVVGRKKNARFDQCGALIRDLITFEMDLPVGIARHDDRDEFRAEISVRRGFANVRMVVLKPTGGDAFLGAEKIRILNERRNDEDERRDRETHDVATMVDDGARSRFAFVGNEIGEDPADPTQFQPLSDLLTEFLLRIGNGQFHRIARRFLKRPRSTKRLDELFSTCGGS